jgi:tetratricopeptide (TPR) repeat protein
MNSLAAAHYNLGSYDAAEQLWLDSLQSLESGNYQVEAAYVRINLALFAWQVREDYRTASTLYDLALATFRLSGEHFMIAFTLANIAETAFSQGDFAQARQAAEESLTLFDQLGNASYAADRRLMLAKLELADGNPERSTLLLRDVLSAFVDLDQPVELAESMLLCASLGATADPRKAAELLGFGQRLRERAPRRLLKTDRERIDSLIVHLQSALGAKEFDGLEHRGALHSRTTALALARRLLQARLEQEDVVS